MQVSPNLYCGGDLCDGLIVLDEQGGIVTVSFFLLSHILGGFFPQQSLHLLSDLDKPPIPCPRTLLLIPEPSLLMDRATTPHSVSLYQAMQMCPQSPVSQ